MLLFACVGLLSCSEMLAMIAQQNTLVTSYDTYKCYTYMYTHQEHDTGSRATLIPLLPDFNFASDNYLMDVNNDCT